jgi:dihydrofolate synthase/folylpolyglutamate synthase
LTASVLTYAEALEWLYGRIDYERTRPNTRTNPFRLERIARLLDRLGSPHRRIAAIHIAGTKGKGSTAAMLDSILRAAGFCTGLFTSPHIEKFEERMRVDGRLITADQLSRLVTRLRDLLRDEPDSNDRVPTFFEVTTLLAWMMFDELNVRIAVLETGLGGRLDCTNVCTPLVTIITSIGLDHTQILGDTIAEIAGEKAGILKPGVPVVQGQLPEEADRVVGLRANELGCQRLVCGRDFDWQEKPVSDVQPARKRVQSLCVATPGATFDDLTLPLLGRHQLHNASVAVMAASLLRESGLEQIDGAAIATGLAETHWPLRFEIFDDQQPVIILDAAHNPDSMRAVTSVLQGNEWQNRRRVLVFAASSDKDVRSMLQVILPHFDAVVLTRFLGNPRSVGPQDLEALVAECEPHRDLRRFLNSAETPGEALKLARKLTGPAGIVCVTGSIYLAAELRARVTLR